MHANCQTLFSGKNKKIKFKMYTSMLSIRDLQICLHFYTLPHNSGWVLWFHVGCLSVSLPVYHMSAHYMSVYPSVFSFVDDNLSKYQWFSPSMVCIDIVEIWYGISDVQIS